MQIFERLEALRLADQLFLPFELVLQMASQIPQLAVRLEAKVDFSCLHAGVKCNSKLHFNELLSYLMDFLHLLWS